jgi:hypothetical protein
MPHADDRLASRPASSSRMKPLLVALLALIAIGAAAWYWWQNREPPYLPPPAAKVEPKAPPPPPAAPVHVITPEAGAPPLPTLKESDGVVQQAGMDLVGRDAFAKFFNIDDLVRHIVATVDNLPRETVSPRLNPVRPIAGAFAVRGKDASLAIAPENSARYTPFVRVIEHIDTKKAAALYKRFYPLFQQAYEELGYPGRYFNDRLVEAIDNLLDAPEPTGPIALTVPHVLYEYRDPELESRSAGQKMMMRAGRENEAKLKAKLRELRREVAVKER